MTLSMFMHLVYMTMANRLKSEAPGVTTRPGFDYLARLCAVVPQEYVSKIRLLAKIENGHGIKVM